MLRRRPTEPQPSSSSKLLARLGRQDYGAVMSVLRRTPDRAPTSSSSKLLARLGRQDYGGGHVRAQKERPTEPQPVVVVSYLQDSGVKTMGRSWSVLRRTPDRAPTSSSSKLLARLGRQDYGAVMSVLRRTPDRAPTSSSSKLLARLGRQDYGAVMSVLRRTPDRGPNQHHVCGLAVESLPLERKTRGSILPSPAPVEPVN